MPRDSTRDLGRRRGASEDDRFVVLKRRVQLLARMTGAIVHLVEGPHVVAVERITGPDEVILALRERGALDLATFTRHVQTAQPPLRLDAALVATARRELRALASPPALAMARDRRRALARYGAIDEAWLRAREADVAAAAAALVTPAAPLPWFARVVELVRAREGSVAADRVQNAHDDVLAAAAERRKRARARVAAIVTALETGEPPDDAELARLAERLDAARDFPGRARRRRALDVLRHAIGWPDAPADAVAALSARGAEHAFAESVLAAGLSLADRLPAVRDPKQRAQALELVALLALAFPLGDGGVPVLSAEDGANLLEKKKDLLALAPTGIDAARAVALAPLRLGTGTKETLAKWVAEGLDLALVVEAVDRGWAASLAQVPDVRAARAYATWAGRLVPHYESLGIPFSLSPELFARLPKNADLGVLAICLLEAAKVDDPAAVLDATLGLFQKLPAKATRILGRLRGTEQGAGRRAFPDFAAWLGEDELLDRYVHVTHLAGEAVALTHRIREDFEHATKTARERAHLESLAKRNVPQEGRLALLRQGPRRIEDAPKGRTKRRLAERIEALLPIAYRKELDATFREIMRDAWGIAVPSLTPAWRDAVRFWLVVDDNRELLGKLLREAAKAPGQDVKLTSAKNRAWVERASRTIDVAAWLAPREQILVAPSGARFTVRVEQDPLEVLRMGIPFGTCLSLVDGCNAASTVLNAFDANKRVIYVRGEGGKIVARKLVALGETLQMLGYNLYLSVRGGDEAAIRAAVDAMCIALTRDAGTRLGVTGAPPQIHPGFWYDDGAVPFAEDEVLAAYCRAHGLEPPAKPWEGLGNDASGWAACDAGDVDAAIAALTVTQTNPAALVLGRWIVERLGTREAIRRLRSAPQLLPAIARALGDEGEDGAVRALGLAARAGDGTAYYALPSLLARFPRSAKIASAFVSAAEVALARTSWIAKWGTAHRTFEEVAPLFDDVSSSLALLDRLDRLWAAIVDRLSGCADCRKVAEIGAVRAVSDAFLRARDDDAVVATLMSARRSPLARRAALRIAARHVLANGARALTRLATIDPGSAASPDGLAAHLVQANVGRITDAVLKKLPEPSALPFEGLGPLLFSCADIDRLIARAPRPSAEKREPGPWELSYLRRRGEVEGDRALADQVASAAAGRFDVTDAPAFDRFYVELARRSLARDASAAAVLAAGGIPFLGAANVLRELFAAPPSDAVDGAIATALGKCARSALAPDLVAVLWQRASLRPAIASALAKGQAPFGASLDAVERAADRAGLALDGFTRAVVLAQLATVPGQALAVDSIERLREIVSLVVRHAPPSAAAAFYDAMPDLPSVALFVRALRRAPVDRAAAIRTAASQLDPEQPRTAALAAWLRSTRSLRGGRASSIERG